MNHAGGAERVPYPLEAEQELLRAIARGDRDTAETRLNQLLSHIYYYALDEGEIHVRVTELLVVMIRAAAAGGMEINQALDLSRRYLREIRALTDFEDMTLWLSSSLRYLMEQMFSLAEASHSDAMRRAIGYMKRNYAQRLSLEETARQVGYSPSYFSRIFREDTGMAFSEYLTRLRVDKGKSLLASTRLSVTEIGAMLGFSDQSHFSRSFKKLTGVSPDRYRKNTMMEDS